MKLIKKWLIYLGCFLVVLFTAVFVLTKLYVTKNFVVEKMEESINSRVQIGELSVSYFGKIELKDVIITARDHSADEKVPHDDRKAIEEGSLVLNSVDFKLSLWEVLSRKVSVETVNIDGVVAKLNLLEDGSLDIDKLFAKPSEEGTKTGKKFNAKENDLFITEIEEVNITNVDVDLFNQKTKLLVKGRGVYLKVSEIKVNPKKLETVNNADISVGGEFDLFSVDRNMDYGHVGLSGKTNVTLFNTESGDIEPKLEIDLVLAPKSYLTTRVPLISKVWKVSDMLQKFKINKVRLPERVEFRDNQKVSVAYKLGNVRLTDAFAFQIKDWELEVMEKSQVQTGTGEHIIEAKLFVAQKISKHVSNIMTKSKKVNELLGALTGVGSEGSWFENGRLTLKVESTGTLSDPKVKLKNDLTAPLKGGLEMLLDKDKRDDVKQGLDILKGFLK